MSPGDTGTANGLPVRLIKQIGRDSDGNQIWEVEDISTHETHMLHIHPCDWERYYDRRQRPETYR